MSNRTLPEQKKHFETRRDMLDAADRMEHFGNLPVSLWAAWVWSETGIATARFAWDDTDERRGGQRWRLVAPLVRQAEGSNTTRAEYYFVSQICDRKGAWVRCVGIDAMAQMLSFLDDPAARQSGWNALHGVSQGDAPNVPELKQRLASLPATLDMGEPRPKLTLVSVEAEKRAEVERELASVNAHMGKFFGGEDG